MLFRSPLLFDSRRPYFFHLPPTRTQALSSTAADAARTRDGLRKQLLWCNERFMRQLEALDGLAMGENASQ